MIGLDISDRSIKVVRLSNDKTHRLLSYTCQSLPVGLIENGLVIKNQQLADFIKKTLAVTRIADVGAHDAVVASIPETQSFLRVIEIPMMADDEVAEAAQWEVAQHIPFGIENVYMDWQPPTGGHQPAGGKKEVQVGAAQKKVVDALYKTLSSLNLDIAAFELESQAIVRALISDELRSKQGLLIVDLGAAATNVVIHDHGAMRFTASLRKGIQNVYKALPATALAGSSDVEVVRLEATQAVVQAAMPAMEELVMEIRGVVEFYNSIDQQHEVLEILLTGGGSNLPGLDKAFLRYFDNVHVQRGNPWVNILSNQPTMREPLGIQDSVRFTTALGLALRKVVV